MDKFDEAMLILLEKAEPGERHDAKVVLGCVADALRAVETISADLDRSATALEKIAEK